MSSSKKSIVVFLLLLVALSWLGLAETGKQLLESPNFTVYYPRGKVKLGEYVLSLAEESRRELEERLPRPLGFQITLHVSGNEQEFVQLSGQRLENVLATALPERQRIVFNLEQLRRFPVHKFKEVFIHEYSHIYLGLLVSEPLPRWLDEGIAMHLAEQWQFGDSVAMAWARVWGRLLPLRRLELGFPSDRKGMELAYLQSYSLVKYILKTKYEGGKVTLLIDDLIEPRHGSGMLDNLWDPEWRDSLERAWRRWLGLGLRNWLFFITSSTLFWFGLSLLFVLAYLRKRQRQAEKLQRLEGEVPWVEEE